MNEVVKYSNELHELKFNSMNEAQQNVFFTLLQQFRSSGRWRIRYDDFKELLGIPDSYQSNNIDQQILKPAIKELSAERNLFDQRRTPFKGLCVKKVKSGRSIEALEFCFMPQPVSELDKDMRQHERNLTIIANDIQKDQTLRQLKRKSSKQEVDDVSVEELQIYLYRNLRLYDKQFDRYNVVKIQRILAIPNSYGVRIEWQNVDDGFKQHFDLPSAAAAQNFISKYVI